MILTLILTALLSFPPAQADLHSDQARVLQLSQELLEAAAAGDKTRMQRIQHELEEINRRQKAEQNQAAEASKSDPKVQAVREAIRKGQADEKEQAKRIGDQTSSPDYLLGLAVDEGKAPEVLKQLARGADINNILYEGQPPLMWSAKKGDAAMVKLLLSKGAKIEVTSGEFSFHAVESAAQARKDNTAVLKLLVARKGSVNGSNAPSQWQRARAALPEQLRNQKDEVDRQNGVNHETFSRLKPLHYAVEANQKANILYLLSQHAPINAFGEGKTPLMLAAYYHNAPLVELLLAKGANATLSGAGHETALDLARGKSNFGYGGEGSPAYNRTIELLTQARH